MYAKEKYTECLQQIEGGRSFVNISLLTPRFLKTSYCDFGIETTEQKYHRGQNVQSPVNVLGERPKNFLVLSKASLSKNTTTKIHD